MPQCCLGGGKRRIIGRTGVVGQHQAKNCQRHDHGKKSVRSLKIVFLLTVAQATQQHGDADILAMETTYPSMATNFIA